VVIAIEGQGMTGLRAGASVIAGLFIGSARAQLGMPGVSPCLWKDGNLGGECVTHTAGISVHPSVRWYAQVKSSGVYCVDISLWQMAVALDREDHNL